MLACATTTVAQVTVSRSELVGTKWQISAVYERHENQDLDENHLTCYAITTFDKSKGIMVLELVLVR